LGRDFTGGLRPCGRVLDHFANDGGLSGCHLQVNTWLKVTIGFEIFVATSNLASCLSILILWVQKRLSLSKEAIFVVSPVAAAADHKNFLFDFIS
jgi:hypothetical protein